MTALDICNRGNSNCFDINSATFSSQNVQISANHILFLREAIPLNKLYCIDIGVASIEQTGLFPDFPSTIFDFRHM